MFSYAPLMATLHKKGMTKTELQKLVGASSSTFAKITKDEYVSMKILDDICTVLDCEISDVIAHVKEKDRSK
jgi:putative transcriptional regulator